MIGIAYNENFWMMNIITSLRHDEKSTTASTKNNKTKSRNFNKYIQRINLSEQLREKLG